MKPSLAVVQRKVLVDEKVGEFYLLLNFREKAYLQF